MNHSPTNQTTTTTTTTNTNSTSQQEQDEQAANELLASVDLSTALEFIHSQNHTQTTPTKQLPTTNPTITPRTQLSASSSNPTTILPLQPNNSPQLLPSPEIHTASSEPQATPQNENHTHSPSKNQRLKTISISILRTVARKRDLSNPQLSSSPPGPSPLQSLSPALQSVLSDNHHHHHHPNELERPFFIVDVRSVTAAAERHQANPNQIRRVEECKRFFSLRYELIFTTLAEGKTPPSLVKVAEWRRKVQLVSILRKQREQSLLSTGQPSSIPLPTRNASIEHLRMNVDQSNPIELLSHQQDTYKWICLSSRKRRTMWEICPEDIQAYMSARGTIEDEDELREAERLFGKFDENPIRHSKSSRQRVNSNNKASRWFNETQSQPSDNDSTRSPHSAQASLKSYNYQIRKTSSSSSSSHAIRASYDSAHPETSSSLPKVTDFPSHRHSTEFSLQDKPTGDSRGKTRHPSSTRLRTSSDINEYDSRIPQADSRQSTNPTLAVDVFNVSWSGEAPVSSPHISSAIPLSPMETILPRTTLSDDYCTPPQSKANPPSTVPFNSVSPSNIPSRHYSDHGPRSQAFKPPFDVKSKVKKYHSSWSAADDGHLPFRSNTHSHLSREPGPSRQSKQRLTSLGRGLTSSHSAIPPSPEKSMPNLSRAPSAKGLLNFAKRSIMLDGSPSSSTPPIPQDRLPPQQVPRPTKLSFFHKPPRDWRGWKFDKSHLIFRSNNHTSLDKKPLPILIPPVNDILFVSPFHQPLRTPNHLPKTALQFFTHQQTVKLPILITDLTDEEVQEIQMLIVMATSQLDHSSVKIKESREEYQKYARLLPQIRQEIGLDEIEIRKMDNSGRCGSNLDEPEAEYEDEEERADDKGKGVQSESITSSSSTTTEGSVLSQSVHHEDFEQLPVRLAAGEGGEGGKIEDFRDRLDDSLARIERTLNDLERNKVAFRDSLRQQIHARRLAIHHHEIFLASCSERQEQMRRDRELVNHMKRTVKVFGQEGRMIDHVLQAISNGISRPLISGVVSVLTKMIGIGLKLFSLHSAVYRRPVWGLVWSLGVRYLYTFVGRHHARLGAALRGLSLRLLPHGPSLGSLAHYPPRIALLLEPYSAYFRLATSVFSVAINALVCLNLSLLLTSLIGLLCTLVFHRSKPPASSSSNSSHPCPIRPASSSIPLNRHLLLHSTNPPSSSSTTLSKPS